MNFYKRANSSVIDETIEDDTLIINLNSGHYFSLSKSASSIWNLIIQGVSQEKILESFAGQFPAQRDLIASDLTSFIELLLSENLISKSEDTKKTNELINVKFENVYGSPQLNKYVDMEALILADPIHELTDENK